MIPESYSDLVGKLKRRTDEGEVNWKTTSQEQTFTVDFTNFTLSTRLVHGDFGEQDLVRFEILDSEGNSVDYFDVSEGQTQWDFASDLYNKARRKARQIDLVIGDISQELESEGPVGEEREPF